MEELTETSKMGMHASFINSLIHKNGNRFYSFKDICEELKKAEWSKFDYISPAIEHLIKTGQVERDDVYGICRKGAAPALKRDMGKPKMSRADFDRMTPQAQMEHCKSGGIVT